MYNPRFFHEIVMAGLPVLHNRKKKNIELFKRNFEDYTITIKPFSLIDHLDILYDWVNREYAKKFWGMHGSKKELYQHYDEFLESGRGYSLLFFIGKKPVAFVDYYQVQEDEVIKFYDFKESDFGIHLLMAPISGAPISELSKNVMITCLSFMFNLNVDRVIGEPDINNKPANELVKKVGFRFLKEIEMSYKKANLYYYNKADFIAEHRLQ